LGVPRKNQLSVKATGAAASDVAGGAPDGSQLATGMDASIQAIRSARRCEGSMETSDQFVRRVCRPRAGRGPAPPRSTTTPDRARSEAAHHVDDRNAITARTG
jgi:hypothetical protein